MKQQKRSYRNEEEWRSIFTSWEKSQLSAKQFCRQHAISHATFQDKRRRLLKTTTSPHLSLSSFIPLQEAAKAPRKEQDRLSLSHGELQIHLPLHVDFTLLVQCLKALKEVGRCSP